VDSTPNGVAVRGLRVIYTTEYRRISIWKTVLFLKEPTFCEDHWHVLTVNDGPHNTVARRRFVRKKDAQQARELFVSAGADMSQDTYEHAGWQAVLDAT
jgi:hypothetical protein